MAEVTPLVGNIGSTAVEVSKTLKEIRTSLQKIEKSFKSLSTGKGVGFPTHGSTVGVNHVSPMTSGVGNGGSASWSGAQATQAQNTPNGGAPPARPASLGGGGGGGRSAMDLAAGGYNAFAGLANATGKYTPEWTQMDYTSRMYTRSHGGNAKTTWSQWFGNGGQQPALKNWGAQDATQALSITEFMRGGTQGAGSMNAYQNLIAPGAGATQTTMAGLQMQSPASEWTRVRMGMGIGNSFQSQLKKAKGDYSKATVATVEAVIKNRWQGRTPKADELQAATRPGAPLGQYMSMLSPEEAEATMQVIRSEITMLRKTGHLIGDAGGIRGKQAKEILGEDADKMLASSARNIETGRTGRISTMGAEGGAEALGKSMDVLASTINTVNDHFAGLLGVGGAIGGATAPWARTGNMVTGGVKGAASGALTGAAIGSFVPGIGTGAGAIAGGIIGGITGAFSEGAGDNTNTGAGKTTTLAGTNTGGTGTGSDAQRPSGSVSATELIKYARSFVGKSTYSRGAEGQGGAFDCSGFTQHVYAHFGISLPRTAAAQNGAVSKIDLKQAKAGDLIFWYSRGRNGIGHVAILTGKDTVIEASTRQNGIVERAIWGVDKETAGFKVSGAGRVGGVSGSASGGVSGGESTGSSSTSGSTSSSNAGGSGFSMAGGVYFSEAAALSGLNTGNPATQRMSEESPGDSSQSADKPNATGSNTGVVGTGKGAPWSKGLKNGALPDSVLSSITGGHKMWAEVAAKWNAMAAEYTKDTGKAVTNSSAYRDLAWQQDLYNKYKAGRGNLAAAPGKSKHGWGLAVDTKIPEGSYKSAGYKWLNEHAGKYNFDDAVKGEPWHWQYQGYGQPTSQAAAGIWDVDQDINVRAHEGEMILQKEAAGLLRDLIQRGGASAAGGVTLNFSKDSVVVRGGGSGEETPKIGESRVVREMARHTKFDRLTAV